MGEASEAIDGVPNTHSKVALAGWMFCRENCGATHRVEATSCWKCGAVTAVAKSSNTRSKAVGRKGHCPRCGNPVHVRCHSCDKADRAERLRTNSPNAVAKCLCVGQCYCKGDDFAAGIEAGKQEATARIIGIIDEALAEHGVHRLFPVIRDAIQEPEFPGKRGTSRFIQEDGNE